MNEFIEALVKVKDSVAWRSLRSLLGNDARVVILLWITASLESKFNKSAVSSRGARGMFQFLPSTIAAFKKKYADLPVWSDDDVAVQMLYALRHLEESSRLAETRVPQVTLSIPGKLAATRFFYHNGPATTPKFPDETRKDQERLARLVDTLGIREVVW